MIRKSQASRSIRAHAAYIGPQLFGQRPAIMATPNMIAAPKSASPAAGHCRSVPSILTSPRAGARTARRAGSMMAATTDGPPLRRSLPRPIRIASTAPAAIGHNDDSNAGSVSKFDSFSAETGRYFCHGTKPSSSEHTASERATAVPKRGMRTRSVTGLSAGTNAWASTRTT